MPSATVLTYGHPKGGTPIMLASPLSALDLPLRVLVRVRDDGGAAIASHPIGAVLRRVGVPEKLAARLDPAQQILLQAVAPSARRPVSPPRGLVWGELRSLSA